MLNLPPELNVYISAAMFVIGAYVIALYIGLIVWTFRDIRSRTHDMLAHIMAALLVVLFNLPGLLVYLLIRPKSTLAEEYDRSLTEQAVLHELDAQLVCPSCQHAIQEDFIICPHCHQQLKLRCVGCGRLVLPEWDVCPYCGLYQEKAQAEAAEIEEDEPAAQIEEDAPAAQAEEDDQPAELDMAEDDLNLDEIFADKEDDEENES